MKNQVKKAGNFVIKNWKPITGAIIALLGVASALNWKYQPEAQKALKQAPKVIKQVAKYTNRIDKIKSLE